MMPFLISCSAVGLMLNGQAQAQPRLNATLHEVRIRIVDSFGNALPRANQQASVFSVWDEAAPPRKVTGEEVLRLRGGPYQVHAEAPGFLAATRRLVLRADREVWIVGLEEAPTHIPISSRRLIVQLSRSSPARAEVRLRAQYLNWEQVVSFNDTGEATLVGIPDGRYDLLLQTLNNETERYVVDVQFPMPQVITWDFNQAKAPAGVSIVRGPSHK